MGTRNPTRFPLFLFPLLSLTLTSCLSWTGHEPDHFQTENQITNLFQKWTDTHVRIYSHDEGTGKRLKNFRRNLKYIAEKKLDRVGFSVGLTRFADLSNEEFRDIYFGVIDELVRVNRVGGGRVGLVGSCSAPLFVDWRERGLVSSVKDQGVFGSSWAFSSIGAIEGINAINNGELINLSEQALLDYHKTNYEFKNVEGCENALLCATANQPIIAGVHGSSIDFQLYTGGIYDGACSSNPDHIDHFVLIVGYGSENSKDYWIVKNSWGSDWGMNGYMYIRRNTNIPHGVCSINSLASYPTQISSLISSYISPSPAPLLPPLPPPPPPTPSPPPPSPPSPPPPPPSPPPPSSHKCGAYSFCGRGQTCCCLFETSGFCMINGCCDYIDGVCCSGTDYCCPREYPVCDPDEGFCLKKSGDNLGMAAKKKQMAKLKLPWRSLEEDKETTYEPLQLRKAAMR